MDMEELPVYDSSDYLWPDYDYADEEAYYRDLITEHLEETASKERSIVNLLSFVELMEQCVVSVLVDVGTQLSRIFVLALFFRIATQIVSLPKWAAHSLSSLLGLVGLFYFFGENCVHLVNVSVASLIVLYVVDRGLKRGRGFALVLMTLFYNFVCELLVSSPHDWHQIRGAQMVMSMKIISLGFDLDSLANKKQSGKHKKDDSQNKDNKEEMSGLVPNIAEYFGYLFCPGTCLFGPWIKFDDYCTSVEQPIWNFGWITKITGSLLAGFTFLTLSTCFNQWIIPDNLGKWSLAYRDALAFRASHYFVSFMSEAMAVTAGMRFTSKDPNSFSAVRVADPGQIEVPRSLTEVVKAWNVPMHVFLKTCDILSIKHVKTDCFRVMKPYGVFWAILWTYFCSTLLHGLNFQLGAVLLSLGFYTFAEHKLRARLAVKYSAPIGANKPKEEELEECYHTNLNIFVIATNMAFSALAMFNLAYLGVMFSKSQGMAEGYSWVHTLAVWQELNFASTIVMMVLFVVACIV